MKDVTENWVGRVEGRGILRSNEDEKIIDTRLHKISKEFYLIILGGGRTV